MCIVSMCLPLPQLVGQTPVGFISGLKAGGAPEVKTKRPFVEILPQAQALKPCSPLCMSRSCKLRNCHIPVGFWEVSWAVIS